MSDCFLFTNWVFVCKFDFYLILLHSLQVQDTQKVCLPGDTKLQMDNNGWPGKWWDSHSRWCKLTHLMSLQLSRYSLLIKLWKRFKCCLYFYYCSFNLWNYIVLLSHYDFCLGNVLLCFDWFLYCVVTDTTPVVGREPRGEQPLLCLPSSLW